MRTITKTAAICAFWAQIVAALRVRPPPANNSNVTDLPAGCMPPADVLNEATERNMMAMHSTATHVIYSADDGLELNMMVYDCVQYKRMLFLHIPKNAGSTIEDIGLASGATKWGKYLTGGHHRMPDGNMCSAWHVPPSYFPAPNPYQGPNVEVFCVTRDPWERIVSEYRYEVMVSYKWNMPFVKTGPTCTKQGFNAFVTQSLAAVSTGRRFIADCHMLPQYEYIEGPNGHQWCDHILPIDQLTPRFNQLMADRGLTPRLAPHDKSNVASTCPDLTYQPLNELFTAPAKVAMRRVYAKDFSRLGDSLN